MRKLLAVIILSLLLASILTGCNHISTAEDFNDFAAECSAQEFYDLCYVYAEKGECSYFYNLDNTIIFKTYTMALMSNYDNENYNLIKNQIKENLKLTTISTQSLIRGKTYEVYFIENEHHADGYGQFNEFGFITLNDEEMCIEYYWFSDQDYDDHIYTEEDFCKFYNYAYSWLDAEIEK